MQLLTNKVEMSTYSTDGDVNGGKKVPVADLRVTYSNEALHDTSVGDDPIRFFSKWFDEAVAADEVEPNAMCLCTVDDQQRPSARFVLLKAFDARGFVWYTNYESRKANHLQSNPNAALTFWWPNLQRSVRIEGHASMIDALESDAYFASRPAESRLGAWASDQSRPVADKASLHDRWTRLRNEYLDGNDNLVKTIERPPYWGGYRLRPRRIEFWKGRPARLHDRIVFERPLNASDSNDDWSKTRLQP